MMYKFKAYGHNNITAKHKTTLEFTKDSYLTLKGDCIIGVKADFSLKEIKDFIKNLKSKKIKIIIKVNGLTEEINCEINPNFNSVREMVIRKSDFLDVRTFAVRASKASCNLGREFVEKIKNPNQTILVTISET